MDFDFNVKKLVGEAGSFITRAVQMTEEALYAGEKTTLDPQLEKLCRQADTTKNWTQRIIRDIDSVLVPNPGYRVEDYVFDKIDKKRPPRQSNIESLGQGMIEAGTDFGPSSAYGSMLIKVGQAELKLGQTERDLINSACVAFVNPLNKFIETEVKNVTRERKILENKRLDLDAAKNRLRKARSLSTALTKDSTDPRISIQQAEGEVITCQTEFTAQTNIVRTELEIMLNARDRHLENLKALVAAQTSFYERCNQQMMELNRDLLSMPLHSVSLNQSFSIEDSDDAISHDGMHQGKVMYDYTAAAPGELNVFANELILVEESSDTEYFTARKGMTTGKVPKSCVLLL